MTSRYFTAQTMHDQLPVLLITCSKVYNPFGNSVTYLHYFFYKNLDHLIPSLYKEANNGTKWNVHWTTRNKSPQINYERKFRSVLKFI